MASKIKKIQILRHLTQLASIFLLPGLYILSFDQLKTVYKMVTSGNFHFINAFPSLIELTTVIVATMLLGRFFCGWVCTFGAYNDLIYFISKKLFKTKFKVNPKVDSVLKYTKYVVLLLIVAISWTAGSSILESTSPWDAFAQITNFPNVLTDFTIGCILLALITIGAFFIERFFCRYLCPLGAVFTLVSKTGIFKISKPNHACGKCRACTNNCSMGLSLYKKNSVCGGDCINCFKCIEICPRKNTQTNILGENINPTFASSVAVAAFAGVYAFNNIGSKILTETGIASPTATLASSNSQVASVKYKDGTYTGSGTGFRGATTTVSVTISNGQIASIQTVSYGDTPRFYQNVESTMFNEIKSAQSTDVDTVSGATFSSNGIKSAVQNALTQAESAALSSDASSNSTSNSSTSTDSAKNSSADSSNVASNNNVTKSNDTQNQTTTVTPSTKNSSSSNTTTSNNSSSNTSSSSTQNKNATTNNNTATNSNSTKSSSTTSSSSQQGKYKDGTYTGTGTGFRGGTTKMSVTIKSGKITSISTVSSQDTPRFYDYAESTITNEIVSAQSTSVDTVSGATFSSRGIITAVQNALSQAK